jgi:hypothetical protein
MTTKISEPKTSYFDQLRCIFDEVGPKRSEAALEFLMLNGDTFPVKIDRLKQVLGLK